MKNSLWKDINHGWLKSPAQRLSGGLLISWDFSEIKFEFSQCHTNFIYFKGQMLLTRRTFSYFNVYAFKNPELKRNLCPMLQDMYLPHAAEPGIFIGDFNCVINKTERSNYIYNRSDSLIPKISLRSQSWRRFIWGERDSHGLAHQIKKSKLDQVMVNVNWLQGGEWKVKDLNKMNSDHKPLFLYHVSQNWGPKSFRVFDWWLID